MGAMDSLAVPGYGPGTGSACGMLGGAEVIPGKSRVPDMVMLARLI